MVVMVVSVDLESLRRVSWLKSNLQVSSVRNPSGVVPLYWLAKNEIIIMDDDTIPVPSGNLTQLMKMGIYS